MDWRVIIRWSFDGDNAAATAMRNELSQVLKECGIQNTSTATWESPAASPQRAAVKLAEVLDKLASPEKVSGTRGRSFQLDHIWIYIDRAGADVKRVEGTPRRKPGRPPRGVNVEDL